MLAEVDAVAAAVVVDPVRPRTDHELLAVARIGRRALALHVLEVERRAGEVHVPPARDVERGRRDLRPVVVGALLPEVVERGVLHQLGPPRARRAGALGQRGQRQRLEVVLLLAEDGHELADLPRAQPHADEPFAHAQQEGAAVDGLVAPEVPGRRDDRRDRLEMRRPARGGEPRRLADVGTAGHADVAVAPVLGRDPLDRVVAVVVLVEVREELAVGVEAAAHVLHGDDVAALRELLVEVLAGALSDLVVGRAHEHDRQGALDIGADEVERELHSVAHGHAQVVLHARLAGHPWGDVPARGLAGAGVLGRDVLVHGCSSCRSRKEATAEMYRSLSSTKVK